MIINKKQTYKYIAPSPPAELIDATTFVIDFAERKFVYIGLDPEQQFNVMVYIIIPSRHVSTSPEFLNKIFALMGTILSSTLETPDKSKNIIFFADETIKLTNIVYRAQNVLVIESLTKDGCRVLLNCKNLITLQSMEWNIYESIVRKSNTIQPMVLKQMDKMLTYLKKMYNIHKTTASTEKLTVFIKNINDDRFIDNIPKNEHCFISQIKSLAIEQLVQKWISIMIKSIDSYDVCGFNNCILQTTSIEYYLPPSLPCSKQIDNQPLLNIVFDPLSYYSPLSPPSYSVISPPSSPGQEKGPSFYDLLRIPSPINISAPKRLGRSKHLHPLQTKRIKREIITDM